MRNLLLGTISLIISCTPKSFVVSQKDETLGVYFEDVAGRYGLIKDKTQFYLFKDSQGRIVPVNDSLEAQYSIQFKINSTVSSLKDPEEKIYNAIVSVRAKGESSLKGMAEAKREGEFKDVLTPISKELANNLVSLFKNISKPDEGKRNKRRKK